MADQKKYHVDVDKFLDIYIKNNPELQPLTKVHAGKLLGVHANSLSRLKNKEIPKSVSILVKMSELAGCTINDLLTEIQ